MYYYSPTSDLSNKANHRAGHTMVAHRGRAVVWGGYMENQDNIDQIWPSNEILFFEAMTQNWTRHQTKGNVPSKCSGAAACVLGDTMFMIAGFHEVTLSLKALTQQDEIPAPDMIDPTDNDPEHETITRVEVSNTIWSLDLITLVWTKLSPEGVPPLKCDKTASWSHGHKVYTFGGFGPPPPRNHPNSSRINFKSAGDITTSQGHNGYTKGWSNQLVIYNTATNSWEWPICGGFPPSPRAAHSAAVIDNVAYVFGGRYMDQRLNDLHALNLNSLTWTPIINSNTDDIGPRITMPVGRSWQTMTSIYTGHSKGGLLLYGGFDNNLTTLGDCWKMDLSLNPVSWVRCRHLEQGRRLWHASVNLNEDQVVIVGGITNNILAPSHLLKHHAANTLQLKIAPSSLLKICLEIVEKHFDHYKEVMEYLPIHLKKTIQARHSSKL